ncbi:MAG: T9SS C-terminal target domain-containing protein [Balneolaceae bacterium]|nr:MAG: T9SS C-terminal target domain-containing protein [Balneolaceae bacterium]
MVARDFANTTQDDTVMVPHVTQLPVFDGIGDDECWEEVEWQTLGQVWIPYGEFVLSDDFSGRYKAVWNYDTNLLYLLVEIRDDVLVDGYRPGDDNYPDFDVLEIFIDEDRSGGLHRIDYGDENAENAFSYHIALDFPEVGETTETFAAMDIAGFWERVDYADHFEHFILRRYEHKLVYEMALKVYDDTYDHDNPEASRVQLTPDKIMGFTMAYCDNDDKEAYPPRREKFYGSVWVPEYAYNSHWKNADYFGVMKLIDESGLVSAEDKIASVVPGDFRLMQNYPNPFNSSTTIEYHLPEASNVRLTVYDVTGREVSVLVNERQSGGYHSVSWNASGFATGVYIFKLQAGEFSTTMKSVLIK